MTELAAKSERATPFTLSLCAANPKTKTPETFLIEIASPPDPGALKNGFPPGLRIGAVIPAGFVSILQIQPGRGIVMSGEPKALRRIQRTSPATGPTDEELVQAFLRTDLGKSARQSIEGESDNLKIDPPKVKWTAIDKVTDRLDFVWSVNNQTAKKLKNIRVMAAVTPDKFNVPPAWTIFSTPPPNTELSPGAPLTGEGSMVRAMSDRSKPLGLMVAAEADYGVVIVNRCPPFYSN